MNPAGETDFGDEISPEGATAPETLRETGPRGDEHAGKSRAPNMLLGDAAAEGVNLSGARTAGAARR